MKAFGVSVGEESEWTVLARVKQVLDKAMNAETVSGIDAGASRKLLGCVKKNLRYRSNVRSRSRFGNDRI